MSDPLVAVRCRSVTKSFPMGDGAVEVLHGINLEVPAGELTMLASWAVRLRQDDPDLDHRRDPEPDERRG